MKRRLLLFLAILAPLAYAADPEKKEEPKKADAPAAAAVSDIKIVIKTDKGDIEATIFASKAPMTSANFLNLAKRGFYDGISFHRVISNFMIQGGDPNENGRGGPGYKFDNEISPALHHDKAGILSMANAGTGPDGKGTNGSQFFITMAPTPFLDGKHPIFGEVTKGQSVVEKIVGKLDTGEPGVKADGKGDKITKIQILDSTDALFAAQKENIDKWNEILKTKSK